MRSQLQLLDPDRAQYRGLADRFAVESANVEPELRQLRGSASSAVAQRMAKGGGTSMGSTLDRALRGAKARQGIIERGEPAIRNQSLKNRLARVRAGIAQTGRAMDLQGAGQQIQAGVNLSGQRASDAISNARIGAFGAAAGAFGGYMSNRNRGTQTTGNSASTGQPPWMT